MKRYSALVLSVLVFIFGLTVYTSLAEKRAGKGKAEADLQWQVSGVRLALTGTIPEWLSGSLIRNGPINVRVDGQSNTHWFDGLAMLHAFSFHEGEVRYTNQFLRTDAYRKVFEEGSLDYGGFASDPCRSLFKRFFTLFHSSPLFKLPNANVNVAELADSYVALTETPLPVRFDPKTLETLGVFDYRDDYPKEKCWESAHHHFDPETRAALNYLVEFGKDSRYILYKMEPGSAERKRVAEVPVEFPSYMHSFAITKHYFILTEYPLVVNPLDFILRNRPFIKNYAWQPERGTNFLVVDQESGKIVGRFLAKPFFSFHHANAFEDGDKIHLDIVTYQDAEIITGTSLNAEENGGAADRHPSVLERFTVHLSEKIVTSEVLFPFSHEFPRVNENYDGAPYTYVYATGDNEQGEALYKIDTKTRQALIWQEPGCSPGEPLFVPAPGAKEEDEGAVLALVIDQGKGLSFLLVLDGKSFREIGRAAAPHLIPPGLHSRFFRKR